MIKLIDTAMPTAAQRYRIVCVGCKSQFLFSSDEATRNVEGSTAYCSIPCPACNRSVRWTEQQTLPLPVRADETPLPTITGSPS